MQLRAELQELLLAREELEEVLRRRERELTALKGALKEEVATHDQEADKLREQYEKEISALQTSVEEAKQVIIIIIIIISLLHPLCPPPPPWPQHPTLLRSDTPNIPSLPPLLLRALRGRPAR